MKCLYNCERGYVRIIYRVRNSMTEDMLIYDSDTRLYAMLGLALLNNGTRVWLAPHSV